MPNKDPTPPIPVGNLKRRPAIEDAAAHILSKDIFTRERYYFMSRVLMAMAAAVVIEALLIVVLVLHVPKPIILLADQEGRLTPVVPLSGPVDSLPVVTQWTLQATMAAYTYDFANYRQSFATAEANFTQAGWLGFVDALKKSGDLQSVVDNKYAVSAVATGAPVLESSGNVDGVYQWVFQFPITLTFESAETKANNNYVATVTVQRVSETVSPQGLGIESIILQ